MKLRFVFFVLLQFLGFFLYSCTSDIGAGSTKGATSSLLVKVDSVNVDNNSTVIFDVTNVQVVTKKVEIFNTGDSAVKISALGIVGNEKSYYKMTNSLGNEITAGISDVTIGIGGSYELQVTYQPLDSNSSDTAILKINSNAATDSSYILNLQDSSSIDVNIKVVIGDIVTVSGAQTVNGSQIAPYNGTFDFGTVVPNSVTSKSVEITNITSSPITINSASLTITSARYQISNNGTNIELAPNATTIFDIVYNAGAQNLVNDPATISINTDVEPSNFTIDLTATVSGSTDFEIQYYYKLVSSATYTSIEQGQTIDLGDVPLDVSKTIYFKVGNVGASGQLIVDSVSLSDLSKGFSIIQLPSFILSTAAGANTYEYQVDYQPPILGAVAIKQTTINNDADENLLEINLQANGIQSQAPNISVRSGSDNVYDYPSTSTAFNMPDATLGSTENLLFTIQNTGVNDLVITEVNFSDISEYSSNFSVASNGVITSGASTSFTVSYTPKTHSGSTIFSEDYMTIENNDLETSSFKVLFHSKVNGPEITVTVSGANSTNNYVHDFGTQERNIAVPTIPIQISNVGNQPLTISSISSGTSDFVINPIPNNLSIASGSSSTINLTITPTVSGDYYNILSINSDDAHHPKYNLIFTGTVSDSVSPTLITDVNTRLAVNTLGTVISAVFTEDLSESNMPDISDFIITSSHPFGLPISVSEIAVHGNIVKLYTDRKILKSVFGGDQNLKLTYNNNVDSAKILQDSSGNQVASFTNQDIKNDSSYDISILEITIGGVSLSNGDTYQLTGDIEYEVASSASITFSNHGTKDITFTSQNLPTGVTLNTSIDGLVITAGTSMPANTINFTYSEVGTQYLSSNIQSDANTNSVFSFIAKANVVDSTAPALVSAEVNTIGTVITLTYSELLDSTKIPISSDYSISTSNNSNIEIIDLRIENNKVVLYTDRRILKDDIGGDQNLQVSYTRNAVDANKVTDKSGLFAINVSNYTVVNNSTENRTRLLVSIDSTAIEDGETFNLTGVTAGIPKIVPVELINSGTENINITGISLPNLVSFAGLTSGTVIAPGATFNDNITYTFMSAGSQSVQTLINSNATENPSFSFYTFTNPSDNTNPYISSGVVTSAGDAIELTMSEIIDNTVFIDNTAFSVVVSYYATLDVMSASIPVTNAVITSGTQITLNLSEKIVGIVAASSEGITLDGGENPPNVSVQYFIPVDPNKRVRDLGMNDMTTMTIPLTLTNASVVPITCADCVIKDGCIL